jgi:hypothetical protein
MMLAVLISAFSFQDLSFSLNGPRLHWRIICHSVVTKKKFANVLRSDLIGYRES